MLMVGDTGIEPVTSSVPRILRGHDHAQGRRSRTRARTGVARYPLVILVLVGGLGFLGLDVSRARSELRPQNMEWKRQLASKSATGNG
jgi:hypothetical protein